MTSRTAARTTGKKIDGRFACSNTAGGDRAVGDTDDELDKHTKLHKQQQWDSKRKSIMKGLLCVGAVIFLMQLYYQRPSSGAANILKQSTTSTQKQSYDPLYPMYERIPVSSENIQLKPRHFPTVSALENCTVEFRPPPPRKDESTWRKPFWAPSYPGSGGSSPNKKNGGGDLIKVLVDHLTGRHLDTHINPVKNYHMSMKNRLRRCKGISETMVCTQGHPITSVEPMKQTSNFHPGVIIPIRNFAVAFPVSINDKAVAYHGMNDVGQVPVSEWISTRDSYAEGSFTSWANLIQYWLGSDFDESRTTGNTFYHAALFLPWEDIMDVTPLIEYANADDKLSVEIISQGRGPTLVSKLAQTLAAGGFGDDQSVVTSSSDVTCIWYQVVKGEWERQLKADTTLTYMPMYTPQQLDYMSKSIHDLILEITSKVKSVNKGVDDSSSLIVVLERYLKQIEELKS